MAILPTIKNLVIRGKSDGRPEDSVTFHTYSDDMRFLEIWAKQAVIQLVAGTGITLTPSTGEATDSKGNGPNPITIASTGTGGGYASLTGPGQTTTPGDLTQAGGFTVNAPAAHPITLNGSSGGVAISSNNTPATITVTSGGNQSFINVNTPTAGTAAILLQTQAGNIDILGIANIHITTQGGGTVFVANNHSDQLGFFAHGAAGYQTVTGSKGGNAALASLLTALAALGLIQDSST